MPNSMVSLPKGKSFDLLSDDDVRDIQNQLNNRLRTFHPLQSSKTSFLRNCISGWNVHVRAGPFKVLRTSNQLHIFAKTLN